MLGVCDKSGNETSPESLDANDDLAFLRRTKPPVPASTGRFNVVDLFSGCGGMTIGALEAARRKGIDAGVELAVDLETEPLDVFRETLGLSEISVLRHDLSELVSDSKSQGRKVLVDRLHAVQAPTLLLAGPPCQGHSSLNNHTRHDDPRNDLYLCVASAASILRPPAIIIENVRGISRDLRQAVSRCADLLEDLGYSVSWRKVDLLSLGVPQTRVRHVLIATSEGEFSWDSDRPPQEVRTVRWAIEDLLDTERDDTLNTPSKPTQTNQARMDWLFENDEFNLPNPMRPTCHHGKHSYVSMYGRLQWDLPAQTITSGFGSIGQGRFVHPSRPRTITPHEAARLQFLPDFLLLDRLKQRTKLARTIGNVAPPLLTISIVESLLEQSLL